MFMWKWRKKFLHIPDLYEKKFKEVVEMKANTNQLSEADILTILRAADEIIGEGGRTLLAKILKGSREKKVL